MANKSKTARSKSSQKKSSLEGQTQNSDIIQIILKDHKPLKSLIKIMKTEKPDYSKKRAAFEIFSPALLAHAKPEEQTLYQDLKSDEDQRALGLEGEVEHELADQLCEELKRTTDQDLFMAKVKVLAELVEHHIKEEEKHMLPQFKKASNTKQRASLGENYMKLRRAFLAEGGDDAPPEKSAIFKQREANLQ